MARAEEGAVGSLVAAVERNEVVDGRTGVAIAGFGQGTAAVVVAGSFHREIARVEVRSEVG